MTKHHSKSNEPESRRPTLTQARVRELFDYDSEEGCLVWIKRPSKIKSELGSYSPAGRLRRVTIDRVLYEYNKVVWLWHYGEYPESEVIHFDYNVLNNAVENLLLKCDLKSIPLTQERVRFLFDYNPETGVVTRKITTKYNARAGSVVGSLANTGYMIASVDGTVYLLHRIIWLWYYGYMPENNIDHINRNRQDCSINNLREVTQQCNSRNSCLRLDNITGIKGVGLDKKRNKFTVGITTAVLGLKRYYTLGRFSDFTEAVAHRLAAEQALDWAGCDSNSTAYQYMQNYLKEIRCQTGNKEQ